MLIVFILKMYRKIDEKFKWNLEVVEEKKSNRAEA